MGQVIVVRRTITTTTTVPLEDYNGDTAEQAVEYERQLPSEDKIQAFIESLEWTPANQIDMGECITVETKED